MRRGEDDPVWHLARQLYAAAFEGHPYGRPVIGTPGLVRTLSRDQLVAFYRRHYVPEAFALVVVGAVSPADVLAAAARTLGRLPRSGHPRLPAPPLGETLPRRVELPRASAHAYLGVAWHGPRLDHADTPVVDLLVAILGQGRGSRLTRSVRERLGLVTSITTTYAPLEAAGLITLTAQLEPLNLARAEDEVWREVRRLQEGGVTQAELERARTAAEARREFQAETAEGRAFVLGHAETVWRLEEDRAYTDRLRAVTRQQVQTAAQRYLDRGRFARVLLAPGAHR
jgi:zinc protease